ncbi:hypothetical protein [Mycobacterium botniense]|uniref:Putative lipoprotein LppJ n=1 Tax=Mycobacterium botniense TaxID=84962 RepID=A0A7I9Y1G4_9MYCO|nr:hypothetical protein [Mycobacterium botniense]GFG75922.1 putative lipoprotein LppJ [Mycobacterium botniense]
MMQAYVAYRGTWERRFRSPWGRALIAAALMVSLVLDGIFLAVDRLHSPAADRLEHPADPVTDAQSRNQVVEPAQQIVTVARLQNPTAGYLLMSCKNHDDPPYQGAVYLNFTLPAGAHAESFFRNVAATMVAHGWYEGLPPNQHLHGVTLYKKGVTAIVYPDSDDASMGTMRLYGECRNLNDHRNDTTGWVDITGEFNPTR